jgi:tetratricopeptide (TPR) repeat protein
MGEMENEPQLIRELFDLPGAGAAQVVSQYRSRVGKTREESQEIGRLCMMEGDYEGAITHFRRALEQTTGERHEILLELGAAYEAAGMSPQAYKQYKTAAKIRETGEIARGIGDVLKSYGKNTDALKELRRATEIEPGNAYNHFRLAELFRRMGHPKMALEAIAGAVSFAADDPFYHYWMGDLLLEVGRYDEAVLSFAAAAELSPGDDRLFQLSAIALWGAGKRAEAIRAARLASDLNSEDRVNYGLLEVFLRLNGQTLEADQESKRAGEMDAYDQDLLARLIYLAGIRYD